MTEERTRLARDGAVHFPRVLSAPEVRFCVERLCGELGAKPGVRLQVGDLCDLLRADGSIGQVVASLLGSDAIAVRAVLFDKTEDANWQVAWHQDRTIPVAERHDVEGYGPWSMKDGVPHVAPPIELLSRMVTLRVHLDPCDDLNAPLVVAVGSHLIGRVSADAASAEAQRFPQLRCHAETGDMWAYATPILHMSAPSRSDRHRRVLQLDYAAEALPSPLKWRGINPAPAP